MDQLSSISTVLAGIETKLETIRAIVDAAAPTLASIEQQLSGIESKLTKPSKK